MPSLKETFPIEFSCLQEETGSKKKALAQEVLSHLISEEDLSVAKFSSKVQKDIPIIKYTETKSLSLHLSFLFYFKKHANKFLLDILSNYLIPKKSLKISHFFSTNIAFKHIPEEEFTLVDVQIAFDSRWEKDCAYSNFLMRQQEIMLGLTSVYKAQRIIEMQGESNHEKLAQVQQLLNTLVEKFPLDLDYDIFTLMQQVFIDVKESFKIIRESRYLVRLITTLYTLQRTLIENIDQSPDERHVILRFKQTKLHMPLGIKPVLGVFVSLNFLRENEVFSKKQLFRALQSVIAETKVIEDSFFEIEGEDGLGRFFYVELEKLSKQAFISQEITLLKTRLPSRLVGRIEHLQRPIFMPRNEEEVMKNIVLLSGQLKYVKDIPQVIISFEEQSYKLLTFTVILVRILSDNCQNAQLLLKMINPSLKVSLERERKLGKLRHKYDKEALVMRVSLESLKFLREDDSIDLYKARQVVLTELEKVFGHVRDFNGGMISKQAEAFLKLKKSLGHLASSNKLLLENFFHSVYPIEMRSVVSSAPLRELFQQLLGMLNHLKDEEKSFKMVKKYANGFDIYLLEFHDLGLKQQVIDQMGLLNIMSRKLLQLHFQTFDRIFLGFIYFYGDENSRNSFLNSINRALDF